MTPDEIIEPVLHGNDLGRIRLAVDLYIECVMAGYRLKARSTRAELADVAAAELISMLPDFTSEQFVAISMIAARKLRPNERKNWPDPTGQGAGWKWDRALARMRSGNGPHGVSVLAGYLEQGRPTAELSFGEMCSPAGYGGSSDDLSTSRNGQLHRALKRRSAAEWAQSAVFHC